MHKIFYDSFDAIVKIFTSVLMFEYQVFTVKQNIKEEFFEKKKERGSSCCFRYGACALEKRISHKFVFYFSKWKFFVFDPRKNKRRKSVCCQWKVGTIGMLFTGNGIPFCFLNIFSPILPFFLHIVSYVLSTEIHCWNKIQKRWILLN